MRSVRSDVDRSGMALRCIHQVLVLYCEADPEAEEPWSTCDNAENATYTLRESAGSSE